MSSRAPLAAAASLALAVISGGAAIAQMSAVDMRVWGHTIATRHCGECHAIEPGNVSPLSDAPPVSELYRRFPVERMAEALALGMMDDHPRMPAFNLDPEERAALTAYLSSFAPARPRAEPPRPLDGQHGIIAVTRPHHREDGRSGGGAGAPVDTQPGALLRQGGIVQ